MKAFSGRATSLHKTRRTTLHGSALAVAALIGGAALFAGWRGLGAGPVLTDPGLTRVTFDVGLQTEPSFSPDGSMVAYSADTAGNFDIWVQPVAGGTPVQVTSDPANDWQPDWSPDGSEIAFRSERSGGGVYVVPASGGHQRQLISRGYKPRWSPDGLRIIVTGAVGQGHSLYFTVVARAGGAAVPVADQGLTLRERQAAFGWHPDGRRIAMLGGEVPDVFWLLTVGLDNGTPLRWQVSAAVQHGFREHRLSVLRIHAAAWDGKTDRIYFVGESRGLLNVWSLDADSSRARIVGGPHRLTTNEKATERVSLSQDGRRLVFDSAVGAARIWSYALARDGRKVVGRADPLTVETMHADSPELSPDGAQLVFLRTRPGSGGRRELVIRTVSSGAERTMQVEAVDRGEQRGPPLRWSPDGSRILYRYVQPNSAVPAGERRAFGSFQQIRVLDVRTGAESEITSPEQINDVPFGWSLDGREVFSTGRRYGTGRAVIAAIPVVAAPRAERQARIVTTATEDDSELWQVSLSPNGRWLLFQAESRGRRRSRLMVVPASGGAPRELTDGWAWDDKARWSPDGRLVYFLSGRGGLFNVWAMPFDPDTGLSTGDAAPVTHFNGPGEQIFPHVGRSEMAIRGGRLVIPVVQPRGSIWMLDNLDR